MPGVRIKENENFDVAIRRFRRAVEKAGILAEVRRRQYHESRSEKKKRALAAAIKRLRKRVLRDEGRGGRSGDSLGVRGGRSKGRAKIDERGSNED